MRKIWTQLTVSFVLPVVKTAMIFKITNGTNSRSCSKKKTKRKMFGFSVNISHQFLVKFGLVWLGLI